MSQFRLQARLDTEHPLSGAPDAPPSSSSEKRLMALANGDDTVRDLKKEITRLFRRGHPEDGKVYTVTRLQNKQFFDLDDSFLVKDVFDHPTDYVNIVGGKGLARTRAPRTTAPKPVDNSSKDDQANASAQALKRKHDDESAQDTAPKIQKQASTPSVSSSEGSSIKNQKKKAKGDSAESSAAAAPKDGATQEKLSKNALRKKKKQQAHQNASDSSSAPVKDQPNEDDNVKKAVKETKEKKVAKETKEASGSQEPVGASEKKQKVKEDKKKAKKAEGSSSSDESQSASSSNSKADSSSTSKAAPVPRAEKHHQDEEFIERMKARKHEEMTDEEKHELRLAMRRVAGHKKKIDHNKAKEALKSDDPEVVAAAQKVLMPKKRGRPARDEKDKLEQASEMLPLAMTSPPSSPSSSSSSSSSSSDSDE